MSNVADEGGGDETQYPNQLLGIDFATDANHGSFNSFASAARIGTCTLWSGTGAPTIGGAVGDLYIRTDAAGDSTYFYRCTVAGAAGVATWAAVTGA